VLYPSCETTGLFDLCQPAAVLTAGGWFVLQIPNLIWFAVVAALLVAGIALPFPIHEIDVSGYTLPEGDR
jgi:hypothetical protein